MSFKVACAGGLVPNMVMLRGGGSLKDKAQWKVIRSREHSPSEGIHAVLIGVEESPGQWAHIMEPGPSHSRFLICPGLFLPVVISLSVFYFIYLFF